MTAQLEGMVDVTWQNTGVSLEKGCEFLFLMSRYGIEQPVRFKVEKLVTGISLTYSQVSGVFLSWRHTVKLEEQEGGTLVTDIVEYELPFGIFGKLVDDFMVRLDVKKMLEHRMKNVVEHFVNTSAEDSSEENFKDNKEAK